MLFNAGQTKVAVNTARVLQRFRNSLVLIAEEIAVGVSERVLVLYENDELEGMESTCDYSISQNASNGSEGFRE